MAISSTCASGRPGCHVLVEALALDQLHGDEAATVLVLERVQHHDVGMAEPRHRARLALEAGKAAGVRGHVQLSTPDHMTKPRSRRQPQEGRNPSLR